MKPRFLMISGILTALMLIRFQVSAQTYFTAEVKGKGKPIILIHGLYCSGEVWTETVERYQKDYECHILTLSGFGGNEARLSEHFLQSVKDDVIAYVKSRKLKSPVLIGHSMGGFLSYWAAASAPGLFKKVIVVDGAPFLPAIQMPNITVDSTRKLASNMRIMMGNQTPEQTIAFQQRILSMMITDKERVRRVAELAGTSDAQTQGQVMYELYTTDLRKTVASIECPVLVLVSWVGFKDFGTTRELALRAYQNQLAEIRNCTIEVSDTARHFIFYDDPEWFYEQVDAFLRK